MNEKIERHLTRLFKNPRFWIGLVFLFLFSIIFDFTVAAFVAVHGIFSGKWNQQLLTVGFVYVAVTIGLRYLAIPYKKDIVKANRLLIIVLFVWALKLYGIFRAFYFVAVLFLTARILRFFLWLGKRYLR